MNSGEKVLRNTRADGRDIINEHLKEIQADWDRLNRKISTAKVQLETNLLQWADYSSSYSQLQQLLSERENKLQQVCEQKVVKLYFTSAWVFFCLKNYANSNSLLDLES